MPGRNKSNNGCCEDPWLGDPYLRTVGFPSMELQENKFESDQRKCLLQNVQSAQLTATTFHSDGVRDKKGLRKNWGA